MASVSILFVLSSLVLRCFLGDAGGARRTAGRARQSSSAPVKAAASASAVVGPAAAAHSQPTTSLAIATVALHDLDAPSTVVPVQADAYVHTRPADQYSRAQKRGGLLIPSFDGLPSVKSADSKQTASPPPANVASPQDAAAAMPGQDASPPATRASPLSGDPGSMWPIIESMVVNSGDTDDVWKALAANITFQAESPALHGAQAMVHTLQATDVVLKKIDISWVTQLTPDRLYLFKQMLERWDGPASATIYVHDLAAALKLCYPLRKRVDFHLVLADLHPGRLYPVNTLRNVAINKCRTHWMALVDADFIPNADLYAQLVRHVNALQGDGDDSIYILPAFQLQPSKGGRSVPMTKTELLEMGEKVSNSAGGRRRARVSALVTSMMMMMCTLLGCAHCQAHHHASLNRPLARTHAHT